jgi:hypothetical protein
MGEVRAARKVSLVGSGVDILVVVVVVWCGSGSGVVVVWYGMVWYGMTISEKTLVLISKTLEICDRRWLPTTGARTTFIYTSPLTI